MNTLLAALKVTDARRDVKLAGGLYHRFPFRHLPPPVGPDIFSEEIPCSLVLVSESPPVLSDH